MIRALLIGLTLLATPASAPAQSIQSAAPVPTVAPDPVLDAVWERVVAAQSASQQAYEVNVFVRAVANAGRRDLALDTRDIASNRATTVDDSALTQRPQAFEVTVTVAGRFYVFRPLSRASLDPLLRR